MKGVSAVVIIPTYNECENIPKLVRALLEHDRIGVLVVDDQSPDGTGAAVDALARRVSRSRRGTAPHDESRLRAVCTSTASNAR